MDLMPVPDQSEHQQHKGNQEQPSRFRGIHRMAMVTMLGFLFGLLWQHAPIVSPPVALWPQRPLHLRGCTPIKTDEDLSKESAKSL